MIVGDHVYIVDDAIPRCYDLKTGKNQWESAERLKGSTWGSMTPRPREAVRHDEERRHGRARGKARVRDCGIDSLGRGEQTNSSLAVSDGEIVIRTFKNLYCIREKN